MRQYTDPNGAVVFDQLTEEQQDAALSVALERELALETANTVDREPNRYIKLFAERREDADVEAVKAALS